MKKPLLLFTLLFSTVMFSSTEVFSQTIKLICDVETYGTSNGVFNKFEQRPSWVIDIDEHTGQLELVYVVSKIKFKRQFKILRSTNSFWFAIDIESTTDISNGGITTLVIGKVNNRLSYSNHYARDPQSFSLHYGECQHR